jgi:beta-lactamase superfamily II metal-dependent hydrolase
MIRRFSLALLLAIGLAGTSRAESPPRGLEIHWVDVEGGGATLIVTPAGEGILIDCGYPIPRDAERIFKACQAAGLKQIDHFAVTHWHLDHFGSLSRLSKLIPIRNFYHHGIPAELPDDPKNFPTLIRAYKDASQGKSTALKPGDEIPLRQAGGAAAVRMLCVCSNGNVVADWAAAPLNPVAKEHKPKPEDTTDDSRSLGFLLWFGDFRFLDLGDLTWNLEYKLVSPTDKIGAVDVFQTSYHGADFGNNPVLVRTIAPRVAVINNGPRKGCDPVVVARLRRTPGLEAVFQVHRNARASAEENTAAEFIANADEKCQAEPINLLVAADGKSYTVTAGAAGKPHHYRTRSTR